jgi:hypothetical protein
LRLKYRRYDVAVSTTALNSTPSSPTDSKDVQYNTEHQCGIIVPQGVDIWSNGGRPEAYRHRDRVEYQSGGPEFESSQNDLSDNERDTSKINDHDSALAHILNHLFRLVGKEDITHVCHRVVHGGEYEDRVLITNETLHHLDNLSDLAPL